MIHIHEEIKAYFKYQNHEIIKDVHGMKNAVTLRLTEIAKNQDKLRADIQLLIRENNVAHMSIKNVETEQNLSSRRQDGFKELLSKIENQHCLFHQEVQHVQETMRSLTPAYMNQKTNPAQSESVPDYSAAQFPNKSFLQVVDKELGKDSFRFLVLGGGSVDISNLCTDESSEPDIDDLNSNFCYPNVHHC